MALGYQLARRRRTTTLGTLGTLAHFRHFFGGEGGIRTHDPVIHRIPLFESGAFSHSATSPNLPVLKNK